MDTTINIRVTKAEKKDLVKLAKSHGLSLSAFLRLVATKEATRVLQQLGPQT
jgi:uncharacterized protein (DUF1778 family)